MDNYQGTTEHSADIVAYYSSEYCRDLVTRGKGILRILKEHDPGWCTEPEIAAGLGKIRLSAYDLLAIDEMITENKIESFFTRGQIPGGNASLTQRWGFPIKVVAYEIEFSENALMDLNWLQRYERNEILEGVHSSLRYEPGEKLRGLKNDLVGYEHQVGRFRVFCSIIDGRIILIHSIGYKDGVVVCFHREEGEL